MKRVVRKNDEVHACEKCGKERQHPFRGTFVTSVSKCVKAGRCRSEIDDSEKESRQGIEVKIGAHPRQSQAAGAGSPAEFRTKR